MRLFYSSRFHPLRQLLCRHNYSASSLEPVPRVAIVGSGPAGFYTAQQVLKVCVFNHELICDLIGSYHTMPYPSQQTPTKHTSHRENMSSSKLPHFSLTSRGTCPNFYWTPLWPGYSQLGSYQCHQPIVLDSLWWRLWSTATGQPWFLRW